jgi:hypothetical protein
MAFFGEYFGANAQPSTQDVAVAIDDLAKRVTALEQRNALLTHALRRILEDNLRGSNGAAADVIALEGGTTTINVKLR